MWGKSAGIHADYNDLFLPYIKFYKPPQNIEKKYYCVGSLLKKERYIYSDYPIKFSEEYCDPAPIFKQFKPHPNLESIIDKYSSQFDENTQGIQIRRGIGLNYHPNSCIFSPIQMYINHIYATLTYNPSTKFFIATDSYSDLETLLIHFYNNIICVDEYLEYPIDDGYSLDGMKRTVIDWFLLSKTKHIYASYKCGYAQRASIYGSTGYTEFLNDSKEYKDYYDKVIKRKQEGYFK